MKNDQIFLKHICESIDNIYEFLKDTDRKGFAENKILINAVVRELEIIGEAANKLSSEFRESHTEIIWRNLIDMRNVLIHEYFGVIPESIWETYKKDLPELKEKVDRLIIE